MLHNHKMGIAGIAVIVTLLIVTLFSVKALAQNDNTAPSKLLVAVVDAPPFYIKTPDGRWEGLSIELWQAIAQELNVEFELREHNFENVHDAIKRGDVDIILAIAGTEQREIIMDLSHPFLRSGSAIAVTAEASEHSWLRFAGRLFALNFLPVIGLLLLLALIAGTIVWLFEARRNPKMFGGGTVRGVGHGIWWAIVTLTTVGYGDKAPKTLGGRMVALIWMFASSDSGVRFRV
ncbi:MAG: transporter substrate-binding domain-containing protein [Deltaproteobacteria bacterium]|nr:transporter substrate-binding domain-containing protein [Deltaproteobacteria bacterium]